VFGNAPWRSSEGRTSVPCMSRAVLLVAVVLVAAGCGGSEVSLTSSGTTAIRGKVIATRCSAVSGGFRACTVFHRVGEVSRIERRQGSRWPVLLAADRAPYPGDGWWRRVLVDPRGEMLLAEWSGECEVPFTYLIRIDSASLRRVFRPQAVTALGWTSDGLARVKLLKPLHTSKPHIERPSGIYLVTPKGHVVRLERRVPPSLGC
jgi:hypothetical protein